MVNLVGNEVGRRVHLDMTLGRLISGLCQYIRCPYTRCIRPCPFLEAKGLSRPSERLRSTSLRLVHLYTNL